jgi:hemoglobin
VRTLFDRLGGRAAITAVVDDFYDRLTRDPRVLHQFAEERLPSLRAAQVTWLTTAFGGAPGQPMADLEAAHRDVDITHDQVTAVLTHLEAALGDAGVDDELKRQAMAIVARLWFARVF